MSETRQLRCERVSTKEASRILGMNCNAICERMRRGLLPIGYAYSPKDTGSSRWSFVIMRPMLDAYVGYKTEDQTDEIQEA